MVDALPPLRRHTSPGAHHNTPTPTWVAHYEPCDSPSLLTGPKASQPGLDSGQWCHQHKHPIQTWVSGAKFLFLVFCFVLSFNWECTKNWEPKVKGYRREIHESKGPTWLHEAWTRGRTRLACRWTRETRLHTKTRRDGAKGWAHLSWARRRTLGNTAAEATPQTAWGAEQSLASGPSRANIRH